MSGPTTDLTFTATESPVARAFNEIYGVDARDKGHGIMTGKSNFGGKEIDLAKTKSAVDKLLDNELMKKFQHATPGSAERKAIYATLEKGYQDDSGTLNGAQYYVAMEVLARAEMIEAEQTKTPPQLHLSRPKNYDAFVGITNEKLNNAWKYAGNLDADYTFNVESGETLEGIVKNQTLRLLPKIKEDLGTNATDAQAIKATTAILSKHIKDGVVTIPSDEDLKTEVAAWKKHPSTGQHQQQSGGGQSHGGGTHHANNGVKLGGSYHVKEGESLSVIALRSKELLDLVTQGTTPELLARYRDELKANHRDDARYTKLTDDQIRSYIAGQCISLKNDKNVDEIITKGSTLQIPTADEAKLTLTQIKERFEAKPIEPLKTPVSVTLPDLNISLQAQSDALLTQWKQQQDADKAAQEDVNRRTLHVRAVNQPVTRVSLDDVVENGQKQHNQLIEAALDAVRIALGRDVIDKTVIRTTEELIAANNAIKKGSDDIQAEWLVIPSNKQIIDGVAALKKNGEALVPGSRGGEEFTAGELHTPITQNLVAALRDKTPPK